VGKLTLSGRVPQN